jgi:signal transduction histidine kinase
MNSTGIDAALLAVALGELPIGIAVAGPDGTVVRASSVAVELLDGDLTPLDAPFATALGEAAASTTVELDDRTISIDARPLRSGDETVLGAVALVQDVSDQVRTERAEREFIANAAHELRTPLAAIASAVEVLEQGAKELRSERDLFLSHIAVQSERMQRVIAALLTIARYDAGTERPKVEIVPLRRVLADVAAMLVPATGVTVAVRCAPAIAVVANANLLEEAIANIATNAARYTEQGHILLACASDGDTAEISVEDTGRGIAPDDLDRVFDRFYRGGARDAQGFGLGLPIAKRAVESVGGTIGVRSEAGKGTTVTIRLPLAHMLEAS